MITDSLKSVLGNTKLIVKSVLDLVPAVIVAVIVAIIAGYGMNSLNNNFEKILDNQSKLVSVLKSSSKALNDWQTANTNNFVLAVRQENSTLMNKSKQDSSRASIQFDTFFGEVEFLIKEIYDISRSLEEDSEYNATEFEQQVKLLLISEQRLRETKLKLKILSEYEQNRSREVQTTGYYRKYYRAWSAFLGTLFFIILINIAIFEKC